jgi:hypothetical protein
MQAFTLGWTALPPATDMVFFEKTDSERTDAAWLG